MSVVSFVEDENRIYAGYTRSSGNDFFIWYSDDLGDTWNIFAHEFQYLYHLYIYDSKIWTATNNGLWFYNLEPNSVEAIKSLSDFELFQNFPNPFNPSTTIQYSLRSSQFAILKVYDMLGNEITTLVNKEMGPGKYSVEFSVSKELASGLFFYRLQVGESIQTKKMTLIK